MKKNLIYTVAFDAEGYRGARMMVKLLTSSLLKTMWSGDIIVFRNDHIPLFPVGRPGLKEVLCEVDQWDATDSEDINHCLLEALQWRFKARHYIDDSHYNYICYLDCDCLALRNLDHLFQSTADVLIQRERGRAIQDAVFAGYLSNDELNMLTLDGVNAGSIAMKGSIFQHFTEKWEEVFESEPLQHKRFRDQTALNRLLLDSDFNVRSFEKGEIRFPFHIDSRYQDYRESALVHLVGEGQKEKIDFAFAFYMSAFYNDGNGFLLDLLEI